MAHRCSSCNKKIDIESRYCAYCGYPNKSMGERGNSGDETVFVRPENITRYTRNTGLFGGGVEFTDFSERDYRFLNPDIKLVDRDKTIVITYEDSEEDEI